MKRERREKEKRRKRERKEKEKRKKRERKKKRLPSQIPGKISA